MKKILIILFLIGLAIFSYPMISNIFSTQVHRSVVQEYSETVKRMDSKEIEREREKAVRHNQELAGVEMKFNDPFAEGGSAGGTGEDRSYYDALNIGPAIGSVEIPTIGEELPIYHGTSEEVLSKGVGHLKQSSLPTGGAGTHSVLTAHRGLPSSKLFRNLGDMELGDRFYIEVLGEKMAYEVYDINVVLPHETDWLRMEENEDLVTLLTCDPYMINTHRLLVTGKRVPYEAEDEKKSEEISEQQEEQRLFIYIGAAVLILLGVTLTVLYRKRKKRKAEQDEA